MRSGPTRNQTSRWYRASDMGPDKQEDSMKKQKVLFAVSVIIMLVSLSAVTAGAGDFDWMRDFNARADADPSGFQARLAARFKIGAVQVNTILSNVERPADAYMICRLGEMSSRPPDYVIKKYKLKKGKGWGVIAKSLGIKPGSKEFHALKSGNNFFDDNDRGNKGKKGKSKNKDKSKGKGVRPEQ